DGAWGLTDIPSTAYIAQANMAGNSFFILKAVAGSVTQLGSTESFTYATGVTYAMRVRCEGSTVSMKLWDTAGSEPGPWAISETDTGITGAGQTGLSCRTLTGGTSRQVRWDNFSVQGLAVDADAPATTVELAVGVPSPTVTATATPTPSPVVA